MATVSWDRWEEPDRVTPVRIAAITSAIVLHVAAFLALLIPARWEPPVLGPDSIRVVFLEPKVVQPPPPPPPEDPKPVVQPPKVQPVVSKPTPVRPQPVRESPIVVDTARPMDTQADPPQPPSQSQAGDTATGPSGPASKPASEGVVVLVSPKPSYPREALMNRVEGTVLLRIVVDAQGNPTSVTVEKSSGNRDLDKSARDTVSRRWKFQGTGVQQTARLPIGFSLD